MHHFEFKMHQKPFGNRALPGLFEELKRWSTLPIREER